MFERAKSACCFGLLLLLSFLDFSKTALATPSHHLVGWANALLPGSGQALLGNPGKGAMEATYEVSSFAIGYRLSNSEIFSLDGFAAPKPLARLRSPGGISYEHELSGDLLQEFGLKAHMVNTFDSYRQAALQSGIAMEHIDQTSTLDLFKEPFQMPNLSNPWVYIPILTVFTTSVIDYLIQTSRALPPSPRFNPNSNALYAFNYGLWQPFGSGAPEEMFYRGFLQNEFYEMVPSPFFAIPLSSLLFSLSHAPGEGRYSAAIAGGYLGYLSYRYQGKLGPGITVHFWSGVILGLETILLSQRGQRSTPPASFDLQINF